MPPTWFGPGTTLEVGGFKVADPCVYVSRQPPRYDGHASDPAEIVLHAEVKRPRGELEDLGYWPWYARAAPEHRFRYLEWLASGKKALPSVEGYLFLYFYGLERRLLLDGADRSLVLREVVRLRKLDEPRRGTKEGNSFRNYSTGLLWFEVARAPQAFEEGAIRHVCSLTQRWTPESLVPALAWHAKASKPMGAELARHVASLNPRSQQSVVIRRVPEKFHELFAKRFNETHGTGLNLKVSKRPRKHTYRPASSGLVEVACTVADPTGIPSQFEPLADLWNSCVDDLRKLSKVAAAPESGPITIDAWEAMPPDLREGIDHPLTREVQTVVASHTRPESGCVVPAGALASLLKLEQRPKLTATQSRRLAETVEYSCYALEPDVRIAGGTYAWDEQVSVFLRMDDSGVDSNRYNGAACMLRLGLAVASADGTVGEEEMRRLTQQIEAAFQLPDHERKRLEALKALLIQTGSDIGPVARKIEQSMPPLARASVGRLLVAVAAADGVIDRKELAALRKCYRALGLGPEVLDATMQELAPAAGDGMVTVQRATGRTSAGEPIPAPAEVGLQLNRAAISAIMSETREVARLLADAMAVEESGDTVQVAVMTVRKEVAVAPAANPNSDSESKLDGCPARYRALFVQLITRDRWALAEAEALARSSGHMLSGAVEAINDWAFDALGGPVLEDDGESLLVERTLL